MKTWLKITLGVIGLFVILGIIGSFSDKDASPTGNVLNEPPQKCIPNWQCSSWSECGLSKIQTRLCNDLNNCGINLEKPVTSQTCIPTQSQIIAQSITPDYEEIFRHSENYEGKYIHIKGEAIQVLYDDSNKPSDLRINSGFCDYGVYIEGDYCKDTYYLTFTDYKGDRILEGDIVDVYGIYGGLYSYQSIFGQTITIPKVEGLYADIFG